jgi:cell division septation protein DedD
LRPTAHKAARRAAGTVAALAALLGARAAGAQAGVTSRPGPYERALRLVESGRGAEGRALTDSLVGAATPASPALGEALWWRAALAADAASTERDLRRLMDEVPASPRSGPAAVRLAQLALLRDRPDDATALLEPLVRGRAGDAVRGLAGYWLARARLERRDAAGACAAIAGAAAAPVVDADVTRQLAGLRQRVPGCGDPAVAAGPTAAPASAPPPAPASSAAPREIAVQPSPSAAAPPAAAPASPPSQAPLQTPAQQVPAPQTPAPQTPGVPGPAAPAEAGPRGTPAGGGPAGAPTAGVPSPAVRPAPAAAPARPVFAVQVAAYDALAGAAALAARLRAGGLDAFAEGQGAAGDAPPFRVKVGRHPARAAAVAELAELRRRGLSGFVTTARAAAPSGPR